MIIKLSRYLQCQIYSIGRQRMHILNSKPKALHQEKSQGSISPSHAPKNVIQEDCQTNHTMRIIQK